MAPTRRQKSANLSVLDRVDRLKAQLDEHRPLPADAVARVQQKLRLDFTYHSNAVEGNSLSLGETRNLIMNGITAQGKPMRDHLDIQGHNDAVKAIEDAVQGQEQLNEVFIRNLHKILLREPYDADALGPDGQAVKRPIAIGRYKQHPNNVQTSTGEMYHFTPPEQTKAAMGDLLDWYRKREDEGEHPVILAAAFHYRFVRIHPFDDGNGRMARLLMNLILLRHGYTIAIVPIDSRDRYIQCLEQADAATGLDGLAQFIAYIAECCICTLDLHLRAASGEDIEDSADIDKEIALFKKSMQSKKRGTVPTKENLQMLHEFKEHCHTRINKLRDDFPDQRGGTYISAQKTDGAEYHISEDALLDGGHPKKLSVINMDFNWHWHLESYQGSTDKFIIKVGCNIASAVSAWTFSAKDDGNSHELFHKEYQGNDLEAAKKHFNNALRAIMRAINQAK